VSNFPDISWQESRLLFLCDSELISYVCFVVDQHADLKLHNSIKQQSTGRNVIPLSYCIQTPIRPPVITLAL